jgi:D-beta-D-heptose 7-phosphate kinase/D-beta-D-heptose 1-phosphate adenosyltransferase
VKRADLISNRIHSIPSLIQRVRQWRVYNKTIAFTNGVFDILHPGHIYSLSKAAAEADYLVVAINSDSSVKKLKGKDRPVNDQDSRATILSALVMIDAITIFDEETPLELIKAILPDVLIKGGDYTVEQVAGAREVIENGGRVVINPLLEGFSTSAIIDRINK